MTKLLNDAQRRIEALRLTGSGAGCLDSFIRCANSNDTPLDLATLRMAREIEQHSPGFGLDIAEPLTPTTAAQASEPLRDEKQADAHESWPFPKRENETTQPPIETNEKPKGRGKAKAKAAA